MIPIFQSDVCATVSRGEIVAKSPRARRRLMECLPDSCGPGGQAPNLM